MIKKPEIFLISIIALLGVFCLSSKSLAETAYPAGTNQIVAKNVCDLQSQLKELKKAGNNQNLADWEKYQTELKIRKGILENTLDCGIIEIANLKTNLISLSPITNDLIVLKNALDNSLSKIADYYNSQKPRVSNFGLSETKVFAQNLKNWRADNYEPLLKRITNLNIWLKNQTLFEAARSRLDKINQTVRALKLVDSDKIQQSFRQVKDNFGVASDANTLARQSLKNPNSVNDFLPLMQLSLDALAQTYQNLFELSDLINTLLPH